MDNPTESFVVQDSGLYSFVTKSDSVVLKSDLFVFNITVSDSTTTPLFYPFPSSLAFPLPDVAEQTDYEVVSQTNYIVRHNNRTFE